jgi:hypothetical protein
MKVTNDAGEEIEVYTAEELQAAVTAKEGELTPKLTQAQQDLEEARTALGARATEFSQFRKLNDEQVKKLTIAERTIYENGLALEEERQRREASEKATREAQVDSALRAKVGTDDKLFTKAKEMWAIIGIDPKTPEEVERKVLMVLGAIGTTEPNLVAAVPGFTGGTYIPPVTKKEGEGESFADTEQGKAAAAELGLTLEKPKTD